MKKILPNLYRFEDTCNVYVLTHGNRSLLIDCGSGKVLDAMLELGVEQVDWVLFTHHHRDQCYGAGKLVDQGARLAVPEHERFLFEQADAYWQQKRIYDNYNDRNTFFAIGENLPVAESLVDYEAFRWGPFLFHVLPTPGHSLGGSTLIVEIDGNELRSPATLRMRAASSTSCTPWRMTTVTSRAPTGSPSLLMRLKSRKSSWRCRRTDRSFTIP